MNERLERIRAELHAASDREEQWLRQAIVLAQGNAPEDNIEEAYVRHSQARINLERLLREYSAALLD
jgi:hypothetical protein